ncbi:hypothetical protein AZL_013870 [Azospirillum sp. B510]|uniref:hypothetical protein n=1 Tax=Azospirillum sp. (strain B510) TaxID=137722 RepID=UPI0001C4C386|nr:hypothetical protein [Azospirillum sp. B510]BAI72025.1 hypothetical protein AZL_013870 [Azospirillum sp. B510]
MAGKLTELAQQRARLEARAAELRTREKTLARQSDGRRKVIVGAIVLKAISSDGRAREWLVTQLRRGLSERDRPLFADLLPDEGGGA